MFSTESHLSQSSKKSVFLFLSCLSLYADAHISESSFLGVYINEVNIKQLDMSENLNMFMSLSFQDYGNNRYDCLIMIPDSPADSKENVL